MDIKNSRTKLGLWLSTFISIVGLLVIVFISYAIEKTLDPDFNRTLLKVISVIIAIFPPLLWLTIFYRQDRLNPEPKSFVFKTLLLGALVQKAVYTPIISLVFPGGNTGLSSITRSFIITIVLIAVIQEAVKLLSVRYSIYPSKEFDEVIDGIIYGSALGLGFAAMTSIDNILTSEGALLSNVTALVVIETFAHASITGLSGYILGVSKHKKFNILRLPFALIIASALNAVTQFLLNTVIRQGFKVNYIIGLIPAALVAIAVFAVLVFISSKHEKEGAGKVEVLEPGKAMAGILPVWVILAVTLVVSLVISQNAQKNAAITVDNTIDIKYPSEWIQFTGKGDIFKAADMLDGGNREFVSVKKLPLESTNTENLSEEERLQNAAASWSIKAGMNYRFYQAEKVYSLSSKGKETYIIDYVYIANNKSGLGAAMKPDIGYGRDILSIKGNDLYVITISSKYEDYILNNNVLNEVSYSFVGN